MQLSSVPNIGDGFWDRLAAAVMAVHEAEASVWNGRIDFLPQGWNARGRAGVDGTLYVSRQLVVEPLQRLYAAGPEALSDPGFATASWHAFKAPAHELGHLTAPAVWTLVNRQRDLLDQPDEQDPAEEGFDEAVTYLEMPRLIQLSMPPALAAALHRAVLANPDPVPRSYPGWTAAAVTFAHEVSAEFHVPTMQVLRVAGREPASRKPGALAGLMVAQSRLPVLLGDPARVAAFQAELARVIGRGFAGLQGLETVKSTGMLRGVQIAGNAITTVRTAESFYAQVSFDRGIASAADAPRTAPGDASKPHRRDPGQGHGTSRSG